MTTFHQHKINLLNIAFIVNGEPFYFFVYEKYRTNEI